MTKVSIIIPTYNRENYISYAIDSVLAQTYKDFEIIIVDDGSVDNTRAILSKYDNQIKYFYKANGGEASARNFGINIASGEYVAFLDSDDYWETNKLETQVREMDNDPTLGLTYCAAKRIDFKNRFIDIKPTEAAIKPTDFLVGARVPMTVLVKKSCFNDVGLFDKHIKVGVDTDLWLRFSLKHKISFLNKVMAIIKTHSTNISSDEKEIYIGQLKILKKLISGNVQNNFNPSLLQNLLAKYSFLLGRANYYKKNYYEAVKDVFTALWLNPIVGLQLINRYDSVLLRFKKIINPYLILFSGVAHSFKYTSLISNNDAERVSSILYYEPSSGLGGSAEALITLLENIGKDKYRPLVVTISNGPKFNRIDDMHIKRYRLRFPLDTSLKNTPSLMSYLSLFMRYLVIIMPQSLLLMAIIIIRRVRLTVVNTDVNSGIPMIIASKVMGIPCMCYVRLTRSLTKSELFFSGYVARLIPSNKNAVVNYSKVIKGAKVDLIYDGLNLNTIHSEHSNIDQFKDEFGLNGFSCVCLIGRFVEGKGHDIFIKSANIVNKINRNVKFIVVGSDISKNKLIEKQLIDLMHRLNLESTVVFTGWRNDVYDIISGCEMLVQSSSTFPEGFGLTCIQAMALHKPVIATRIPGPSDIVVDGETGFLVPPGDANALAEKILYLLDNPAFAKDMGEKGRKRAEELFDIKKNVKQVEVIYEELLTKK